MAKKPRIFVKTEPLGKVKKEVKAYVKKALNRDRETKVISTLVEAAYTHSSPLNVCLTDIDNGNTNGTRDGNKITVSGINAKLNIYTPAATTVAPTLVRIVMVRDKKITGTPPTFAEVFPNTTVTMAGVIGRGLDEKDYSELKERFDLLLDRTVIISNINGADNSQSMKLIKINKKLASPVLYNGDEGTDESKGQIYLMVVPETDTGSNIYVASDIRTYYKDN